MPVRLKLRPAARRALLTLHIIAGVGLLGDTAAVLAVNVRAATTDDPALAAASYELLGMFSLLFGIPLSLLSLGSGVLLGWSSKWGVMRPRLGDGEARAAARRDPRGRVRDRPRHGRAARGRDHRHASPC